MAKKAQPTSSSTKPSSKNASNPKNASNAKKVSKKNAKSSEETPVKNEVLTTPTTSVTATTETASVENSSVLLTEFTGYLAKLQQVTQLMSSLKTEFRTLEKKVNRELKTAQKLASKKKKAKTNRAPSGFVKPTLISKELSSFLGKDSGTMMARTEVTREINVYIRKHNLQDKNNGRVINADSSLTKLLKLKKGEELTYFNLQKYMSPHFAKAGDNPTVSA